MTHSRLPLAIVAAAFAIGAIADAADRPPPWVGNEEIKDKSPAMPPWIGHETHKRKTPHGVPWYKPGDEGDLVEAQWPWQYHKSRTYMPPWLHTRRVIGPVGGTWISWPDWRSVSWVGDDKGSELHRRTQAHSFAVENKLQRLHDWSHPSKSPDYEFLYHEPAPDFDD